MKLLLVVTLFIATLQLNCLWKGGYSLQTFRLASNWENCNNTFPQENDVAIFKNRDLEFNDEDVKVYALEADSASILSLDEKFILTTQNLKFDGKLYHYGRLNLFTREGANFTTMEFGTNSIFINDGDVLAFNVKKISFGELYNNWGCYISLHPSFDQYELKFSKFHAQRSFTIQGNVDIRVVLDEMKLESPSSFSLTALGIHEAKLTAKKITGTSTIGLAAANSVIDVGVLDYTGTIWAKTITVRESYNAQANIKTEYLDIKAPNGIGIPLNSTITPIISNMKIGSFITVHLPKNCGNTIPLFETSIQLTFINSTLKIDNSNKCEFEGEVQVVLAEKIFGNIELLPDQSPWILKKTDKSIIITTPSKFNLYINWLAISLIVTSLFILGIIFILIIVGVVYFIIRKKQTSSNEINDTSYENFE